MKRPPPLIEIWHWSWLDTRWTTPLGWWLAWDPDAIPVGGSDWHRPGSDAPPGAPTTWVEAESRDPAAARAALAAGRAEGPAGRRRAGGQRGRRRDPGRPGGPEGPGPRAAGQVPRRPRFPPAGRLRRRHPGPDRLSRRAAHPPAGRAAGPLPRPGRPRGPGRRAQNTLSCWAASRLAASPVNVTPGSRQLARWVIEFRNSGAPQVTRARTAPVPAVMVRAAGPEMTNSMAPSKVLSTPAFCCGSAGATQSRAEARRSSPAGGGGPASGPRGANRSARMCT